MKGHYPSHKVLLCVIFTKVYIYISLYIAIYNNYTYSAGMKERCRDGCRTSLLIAGVVLVPAIFHTLLPPCHPYITTHFMEMIFSTCNISLSSNNLRLEFPSFRRRRSLGHKLTITENLRFSALIDSIMKGSVQSIRSWTPHHPTTAAAAPDTELMVVCTADDEPDVE